MRGLMTFLLAKELHEEQLIRQKYPVNGQQGKQLMLIA